MLIYCNYIFQLYKKQCVFRTDLNKEKKLKITLETTL